MPTALELTREEWQPYIDAARQRGPAPVATPEARQERERLLPRVYEAAAQLKTRYGVTRVILFGSMANPDWFRLDSDVDLAVEGLSPADFWKAWKLAEDIIADRLIDFVDIESAGESLLDIIREYGVEL